MAPFRFATAPAALVALAAGASVAHAIKARGGLSRGRLDAAQQVVESADMRQMACSIQTWLEEEESKDNLFVKMFRHYFTIPNATNQTSLNMSIPDLQDMSAAAEGLAGAGESSGLILERGQAQFNFSQRLEQNRVALGTEVSLDQRGYRDLLDHGLKSDMEDFAQRIIEQKGLRLLDTDTFREVLRYYDGECATQSFHALKAEVKRGEHSSTCRSAWLVHKGSSATRRSTRRFLVKMSKTGLRGIGATAPMNQIGYHKVATQGRSGEMTDYIKRVLKLMNLEITSEWGLRHFVPYHSGECATQRFVRLVEQLHRAVDLPVTCGGGWVRPMNGTRRSPADLGPAWTVDMTTEAAR